MQIPFVTVDVFTDRKFGGNPLAVIPDGHALTGAQMQAIAGEFNLAETTFALPPQEPSHTAQVRIFTPRAELPFAGHPNIGTAFVLAMEANSAGRTLAEPLVFEEKAGLVRLSLLKDGASVIGARLAPPQSLSRGDDLDVEILAAACSLSASDIETASHSPCIASCGIPLAFVELKTRAALSSARPRAEVFTEHLPAERITGILLYVHDRRDGFDLHVCAALRRSGRSGDRQRQCRPRGAVGEPAARARSEPCVAHRPGYRHGPAEPARGRRRKTRRQDHRHVDRRALRADDARYVGGLGIVIASGAKQSRVRRDENLDCFVACAPRNDEAVTSPPRRP
jgi:trans-2,3-dihydro-3-hydroxyanthranilate isomerase